MANKTGTVVYTQQRQALTLGKLIKSGGAGSVFLLVERPSEVAKLYHSDKDAALYERKLGAMLELRPDLPEVEDAGVRHVQIAWPTGLLRDRSGGCIGFTMPILDVAATSDLEHVLQERQAREEGLPTGLGPKMTLAANLSVMLAALHRRQHYVVDLKPLNVRFYRRSLFIAMLDCDGFSIQGRSERFPAGQVTTDYLAPEFQQRGVKPGQEEAQDCFALAVVLFQLLNSGLHPYSGRPKDSRLPSDLSGRIAAGLYPYGLHGDARIEPSQSSGHTAFPEALRAMFDRAFSTQAQQRPSAEDWAALLTGYARRDSGALVACTKDRAHQHFRALPCAACARVERLVQATRATHGSRGNGGKHTASNTRRQRQAATQAATPASAAAAQPLGPVGMGSRVVVGVVGPLLLGWAMGWGMPAYRKFSAVEGLQWAKSLVLGFHGGLLLGAFVLFLLIVPTLILSPRK